MNINGAYKINLERTARKQVHALLGMDNWLAGADLPELLHVEEQIQSMIETFKANQADFDSFDMAITDTAITVRTTEGELRYAITGATEKNPNRVVLELNSEEMGPITWDVTSDGPFLMIDSLDGLAEYAFERKREQKS